MRILCIEIVHYYHYYQEYINCENHFVFISFFFFLNFTNQLCLLVQQWVHQSISPSLASWSAFSTPDSAEFLTILSLHYRPQFVLLAVLYLVSMLLPFRSTHVIGLTQPTTTLEGSNYVSLSVQFYFSVYFLITHSPVSFWSKYPS